MRRREGKGFLMEDETQETAARIRALMRDKGWSQQTLAEMAGVAPPELTMGEVPVTLVTKPPPPLEAAVRRPLESTVKLAAV